MINWLTRKTEPLPVWWVLWMTAVLVFAGFSVGYKVGKGRADRWWQQQRVKHPSVTVEKAYHCPDWDNSCGFKPEDCVLIYSDEKGHRVYKTNCQVDSDNTYCYDEKGKRDPKCKLP